MKALLSSISIGVLFLGFSCSKQTLLPLEVAKPQPLKPQLGVVEGRFCTFRDTQSDVLRVGTIIDASGSNRVGQNNNGLFTDIDGQKRFGALLETLSKEEQNENKFYTGFTFFDDETRTFQALDPSDPNYPYTNNLADFSNAVQVAWTNRVDNNGTPYKRVLLEIIRIMQEEAQKALDAQEAGEELVSSNYVWALVSDGRPTDLPTYNGSTLADWKAHAKPLVDQIMDLPRHPVYGAAIKQVVINTAFYFHPDELSNPDAEELLKYISELGDGDFFSGVNIDWKSLFNVYVKKVNTELVEFFVRNKNTKVDRRHPYPFLERDSDGDGLTDSYELELGSDINKADSDGNGISDFVESITTDGGYPCLGLMSAARSCSPAKARKVTGCFNETTGEIKDTDKDKLADCEEMILSTDPKKWDTNNDIAPDYPAIQNFMTAVLVEENANSAPLSTSIDTDHDGVNDFKDMAVGLHPRVPNDLIEGIPEYKYTYGPTSVGEYDPRTGVTCYDIRVDDITITSPEDTIEINLIEQEFSNSGRNFLRTTEMKMINGYLRFTEEDLGKQLSNSGVADN